MTNFSLIKKAAELLLDEQIVILPTDTIYGLSCLPSSRSAVKNIQNLKNKEDKPFLLLDNDLKRIYSYFIQGNHILDNLIEQLLDFGIWPNNLTLVVAKNEDITFPFMENIGSIGVRYCNHQIVSQICDLVKSGIVSTSVNISGDKELTDIEAINSVWQEKVGLIVPDSSVIALANKSPSAVIQFDHKNNRIKIIRPGGMKIMEKLNRIRLD